LRFKPWLIGPKASKSPFPAVTGTGLGKERDGEKKEESEGETERDYPHPPPSIYMNPHWINTILYSSPFFDILSIPYAQPVLLAQLVGNPRCCVRLVALSELKVMSRD